MWHIISQEVEPSKGDILSHNGWIFLEGGAMLSSKGVDTLPSKLYVILQGVDTLGRGSISSCKRGDLTKGDLIF